MLRLHTECLFCGKPKKGWRSNLTGGIKEGELFIITVCPKCRKKHTIYEIYEKVTENMINQTREYLELGETE